jgi:hypothetical protein
METISYNKEGRFIFDYIISSDNSVTANSWNITANKKFLKLKLKLIYDRQSVGQPVLVSGSHLEPMTRFFFSIWRLRVSWCAAPSLTRGWACNLLVHLLLGLCQSSHSWVEVPQNSWPYFTASLETPPTWRARSLYFYPPGTEWPSYTTGHCVWLK